jgi:hypothetical protein
MRDGRFVLKSGGRSLLELLRTVILGNFQGVCDCLYGVATDRKRRGRRSNQTLLRRIAEFERWLATP